MYSKKGNILVIIGFLLPFLMLGYELATDSIVAVSVYTLIVLGLAATLWFGWNAKFKNTNTD
jgi:hypothetical protein